MGKHESMLAVRFVPSMSHSGLDWIGQRSYAIYEDKKAVLQSNHHNLYVSFLGK